MSFLTRSLQSLSQTTRLQSQCFFTKPSSLQSLLSLTRYHNTNTSQEEHTTINAKEAKKFAALSDQWWNLDGPFKPLHQLNPTRCAFITSSLCDNFDVLRQPGPVTGLDTTTATTTTNTKNGTSNNNNGGLLHGLRILDVGCGGGLLAESLARQGAFVHGIDVNEEGIQVAQRHALLDPELAGRLTYEQATIENVAARCTTTHSRTDTSFHAVIASEVIEHVANVQQFCTALVQATAPGGAIVVSTMSRTPRAYALAVLAAENILGMVPRGTHEWSKFIIPEELTMVMKEAGATLEQMAGMVYNPVSGRWMLATDVNVNYIAYFKRNME